ncbi:MAG: hypothetical protein IKT09_04950 [Synergistes sp.]|nr:hypothetical protein [Synergistes sp.]
MLELNPREFEELQPHEFNALWSGFLARERRRKTDLVDQINIASYFMAYLLNVSGKSLKSRISPADLAKPLIASLTGDRHADTREEDEKYLRQVFNLPKDVR